MTRNPRHRSPELTQVSKALLRLHKALLDGERAVYERTHGRIASNGEYLELALEHPDFAWLRRLSSVMAEIDDLADAEAERIASLRTLLTPVEGNAAFGGRYHEALQRDPDVVLAHGAVTNLLSGYRAKGETM